VCPCPGCLFSSCVLAFPCFPLCVSVAVYPVRYKPSPWNNSTREILGAVIHHAHSNFPEKTEANYCLSGVEEENKQKQREEEAQYGLDRWLCFSCRGCYRILLIGWPSTTRRNNTMRALTLTINVEYYQQMRHQLPESRPPRCRYR